VNATVVLAAGAATWFGSPKQALLLPGVLARVRRSGVDEIIVVAGAYALGEIGERVVECPE
jgi:CTP:molybdopterin cytidylyltransferase MocA